MRAHGLGPQTIETYYSEEGGHEAALQAFTLEPRPTAIFAGADIAALGVLRAAEEHGPGFRKIYRLSATTTSTHPRSTGCP